MDPNILYEDNHLLVVEKAQNVPTQSDISGDPDQLSMMKNYIRETYHKPGNVYLGLVHRLDRPTGGVMVFAKTSKAASRLSDQLKTHQMRRVYLAAVSGKMPLSGNLEDYLLKDGRTNQSRVVSKDTPGAKLARLRFITLEQLRDSSLVAVQLQTGRSHQIRVQMAAFGHPLIRDVKYNRETTTGNLALYSCSLFLVHPTTKEPLRFVCPPPKEEPWTSFPSFLYEKDSLLSLDQKLQIDTNCANDIMNSF